jgi:pimeloyl-ACP methyl ester carboxylesterase
MAQQRIKGATLMAFDGLGHAPQIQDPERFNKTLIEYLETKK